MRYCGGTRAVRPEWSRPAYIRFPRVFRIIIIIIILYTTPAGSFPRALSLSSSSSSPRAWYRRLPDISHPRHVHARPLLMRWAVHSFTLFYIIIIIYQLSYTSYRLFYSGRRDFLVANIRNYSWRLELIYFKKQERELIPYFKE